MIILLAFIARMQLAQGNISQIAASVESANIRLKIAQENMKQYQLQATQATEVQNYLTGKFTSTELYNWMSGQLSSLYFTAYQLASGALHNLQAAYEYELDDKTNFIPANSWNSLKKGLLVGEILKLALARMQDAYMNNNRRRQDIEKIISLKTKKPVTDGWGKLSFTLSTKDLIGKEVPYLKIRSIAVSIPAVVGPYETFGAVLMNTGTKEQITISRGIDDMGVFPEDINDGRYLPFEGLRIEKEGISNWELTVPEPTAGKLSDVLLTIRFTVKAN